MTGLITSGTAGRITVTTPGTPGVGLTAPTYAGSRAQPYDHAKNVYNWKAHNTRRLRRGLANAATGGVSEIVGIGDSIMAGSTLVNGTYQVKSSWPSYMVAELARHGITQGGTGLVRLTSGPVTTADTRWGTTGVWTNSGTNAFTTANAATATFTTDFVGTATDVIYYDWADSSTFNISVNGAASGPGFATVTQSGPAGWKVKTMTIAIALNQNVKMTKVSGNYMAILGVNVRNTTTGGLTLHNVAQPGSTAFGTVGSTTWAKSGTAGTLWGDYLSNTSYLTNTSPDAVFIGLGGNDMQVAGTTNANVSSAITTIRNLYPNSDCVLFGAHQINYTYITQTKWESFLSSLYDLAETFDCPFIDFRGRLGTYTDVLSNGYVKDGMGHLLPMGNADIGRGVGMLLAG